MHRRLAIAFALLASLVAAPEAGAWIEGPCDAGIAAQDVRDLKTGTRSDAIKVDENQLVSVTMRSTRPIDRFKVEIEFAGFRWIVHDRSANGTSWISEVPVNDYSTYGMGLYKVVGSSYGQGFTCSAAALISVEGDHAMAPLASIAGVTGFGLALFGALGILGVAAKVGRGPVAPLAGGFLGLVLGAGVVVLLQQFSVLYPTVGTTGSILALGVVVGLAFSLFGLPTRPSPAR